MNMTNDTYISINNATANRNWTKDAIKEMNMTNDTYISINNVTANINWTAIYNWTLAYNFTLQSLIQNNASLSNSYVPYVGATDNLDLGNHNLTVNRSIDFGNYPVAVASTGIRNLMFYLSGAEGNATADGFRIGYWFGYINPNNDWLMFEKTDANDIVPDGGIGFVMSNKSGWNKTVLELQGGGNANFTDNVTADWFFGKVNWSSLQNINESMYNSSYVPYTGALNNVDLGNNNLTVSGINATGTVWMVDKTGQLNNMNNIITSLESLSQDTLLEHSRSLITVEGGKVNFSIFVASTGPRCWHST
jgi:hypothetical protein